jgi:uncharacterized protein
MRNDVFLKVRKFSERYFLHKHHSKFHSKRVYLLAIKIGLKEKADLDVIKAAALLHDIARGLEDENEIKDHAIEGGKIAKKILIKSKFSPEKIDDVIYCIKVHRFSKGLIPKSLEAKIIQDADRLDMIGAIGIARVFLRAGAMNTPIYDPLLPPKKKYDGKSVTAINHIYEKLLKSKNVFHTSPAKEMAKKRYRFVEKFLKRFLMEWNEN